MRERIWAAIDVTPRRYRVALGVIALVAVLYASFIAAHQELTDDAYITYRFARNLADGYGLRWNPGDVETVYGTSSLPHCLLVSFFVVMGFPAHHVGAAIQILSHAALSVIVALLIQPAAGRFAALAAAFLTALSFPTVFQGLGLEIETYVALSLGALALYSRGNHFAAGVVGGIAVATRLDGCVVGAAMVLDALVRRAGWRPLLRMGAGALLPIALWAAFAYWQFGDIRPQSMLAKLSSTHGHGPWRFYYLFELWRGQPVVPIAIVPALFGIAAHVNDRERVIVFWLAAYLLTYWLAGMPSYGWYFVAPMVGIYALAFLGVGRWIALSRHFKDATLLAGALGVTALLLLFSSKAATQYVRANWGKPKGASEHTEAARWLEENLPPGTPVLAFEIGKLGYFSDFPIIDMFGLVSPLVVQQLNEGGYPEVIRRAPAEFVFLKSNVTDVPAELDFETLWSNGPYRIARRVP